ncbi:hypothetical protein RhiLY_06589 [Ceratobasidium sp. AG-Ba]|nr:hypothetical protein RhiLY_06589 [Ceratobasidium sp. AG-Ba]
MSRIRVAKHLELRRGIHQAFERPRSNRDDNLNRLRRPRKTAVRAVQASLPSSPFIYDSRLYCPIECVPSDGFHEVTAEDESRRDIINKILDIFASVLSVDKKLTHKDNFYHHGGYSLLATRVTSLIRRDLVPPPFTAHHTSYGQRVGGVFETLKAQATHSAVLFAFPFIGGDLDMLPRVVNRLDNVKLGIATYGITPEPGRRLNTLDQMAKAYAESIAQVAGSMTCVLVETTHLIIFDALHLPKFREFHMGDNDFATAFGVYLCKVWFGPDLDFAQQSSKNAVIQAVIDTKLTWHDVPSLIALARQHVALPPWVTDADLALRISLWLTAMT